MPAVTSSGRRSGRARSWRSRLLEDREINGEHELDHDQANDVPLDPEVPALGHQVEQSLNSARDHLELTVKAAVALGQLVLVGEPHIEPLERGMIPEHLGLLAGLDATDHLVLNGEHVPDM